MPKFTFKKQPRETGLRAVGSPHPDVDIKINKKIVGYIAAPNWMSKKHCWRVRFSVEKEPNKENPCPWRWYTLAKEFDSEESARLWVKENASDIVEKLSLYPFDD